MAVATTWQTLYNLNRNVVGSNPNLIYPGQVLTFPDDSQYVVAPGDNLTKIAALRGNGNFINQPPEPITPPDPVSADPASNTNDDAGKQNTDNPNFDVNQDEFGDLEGAIARNQEDDAFRASQIQEEPKKANKKETSKVLAGRRTFNPLSYMSSYTYHLTFYMITPESYANFVATGEANPKEFHILAESAGTNRDGANFKVFDKDFYIDDLSFKTMVSTKHTNGPVVDSTEFNFKIYEPYGFSFVSMLKTAARNIILSSPMMSESQENIHHMQQFYMLGIKFYGYDKQGNLYTSDAVKANNDVGSQTDDPELYDLFPKFYPISLTALNFKLDGKVTVYNIKAIGTKVKQALGTKRNQITKGFELEGGTVEEVLTGKVNGVAKNKRNLIDALNNEELNLKKGANPPTKYNSYNIEFVQDAEEIKTASLVDEKDINKKKVSVSAVTNTDESNDKTAGQQITFDTKKRTVAVNNGISITQFIDQVIGISSYVNNSLSVLYKEEITPDVEEDNPNKVDKFLDWFVVNPKVIPNGFDKVRQDFTFNITYQIQKYKTPYIRSPYVNYIADYYGPSKRYNYLFTGENSEILSYEQTYNALFYLDATAKPTVAKTIPSPPTKPNSPSPGNTSSQEGLSEESVASVRTSLYSPGDLALAKMTIMGDPDFLTQTEQGSYSIYNRFYGPGYSVDPNGGQVFIEIDFKEVLDYDNKTGVMDINKSLEIYKYPEYLKSVVKGITYEVRLVTSNFIRGKFTQDLDLVLWSPPNNDKVNSNDTSREDAEMKKLMRQQGETTGFSEPPSDGNQTEMTGQDNDSAWDQKGDTMGVDYSLTPRTITNENTQGESTTNSEIFSNPTYPSVVVDDDSA